MTYGYFVVQSRNMTTQQRYRGHDGVIFRLVAVGTLHKIGSWVSSAFWRFISSFAPIIQRKWADLANSRNEITSEKAEGTTGAGRPTILIGPSPKSKATLSLN